jgi:hypothetical protein
MNDVVARLKVIWGHDVLIGDVLDSIKDARNELVHRGQFSQSGLTEVMFLKLLVEKVILFLLKSAKELPTRKHLEWFYTYASQGDGDVQQLSEFLQKIKEWRHRKSG